MPKLTSWLVDTEFLRSDLGENGWTGLQPEWISNVLKPDNKSCFALGWSMRFLQDQFLKLLTTVKCDEKGGAF